MNTKTIICLLLISLTPLLVIPATSATSDVQWSLKITNLEGNSAILSYDDLLALPQTTVNAQLACYGTPLSNGDWNGVQLLELLKIVGIDFSVSSVDFKAQDGYAVSIPMSTAMLPTTIVAYSLNYGPLNEVLRLVIPDANGNLWISQILFISMSNSDPGPGYSANPNAPLGSIEQAYSTPNPTPPSTKVQLQTPTQSPPTVSPNIPVNNNTVPEPTQTFLRKQTILSADTGFLVPVSLIALLIAASYTAYRRKRSLKQTKSLKTNH